MMDKWHLANGEARRCSAQPGNCPLGTGEPHFSTAAGAREHYEALQGHPLGPPHSHRLPRHPVTTQALNSSLHWEGEEPDWMDELRTIASTQHGSPPEVLDRFEHRTLGPIWVVWEPQSLEDRRSQEHMGTAVARLTYRDGDGDMVGMLSTSWVSPESMERSWGSDSWAPLRFEDWAGDSGFSLRNTSQRGQAEHLDLLREAEVYGDWDKLRREVWAQGHWALGIWPPSMGDPSGRRPLTTSDAPKDGETLAQEVETILEGFRRNRAIYLKNHVLPLVEYVRLESDLRGQNLGASLYAYAARRMAQDGRALAGSSTQSPEAQRAWQRMARDGFPLRTQQMPYQRQGKVTMAERTILDFRGWEATPG